MKGKSVHSDQTQQLEALLLRKKFTYNFNNSFLSSKMVTK